MQLLTQVTRTKQEESKTRNKTTKQTKKTAQHKKLEQTESNNNKKTWHERYVVSEETCLHQSDEEERMAACNTGNISSNATLLEYITRSKALCFSA